MNANAISDAIGSVSAEIGRGLIAGMVGTAAITIAQMIDMKLTGRGPSNAPAVVGGKVLGVEPQGESKKAVGKEDVSKAEKKANEQKFSQFMHWGYGTGWGVGRGLLALEGIKGLAATAIHFGAIWGTALIMIPTATKAPPPTQWGVKELAKDALMHLVYAFAAGAAFDAIDRRKCQAG